MEWLESAIHGGDIKFYDYAEFSVPIQICNGGFGVVYKSEWNNRGLTIALKKLKNIPLNEEETIQIFVKETLTKSLQSSSNFTELLEANTTSGFYMVLQFANNGDLREYLKINFSKFKWTDKLRIAREISEGLKRDVKNLNSEVHGMVAYIDPKCFECFGKKPYKRSEKSDIYSFGVILWEISSGRPPFQSVKISGGAVVRDFAILMQIQQGTRERPIEGTPNSYIQLYKRCWDYNPELRPTIEEISENLSGKRLKIFMNKSKRYFEIGYIIAKYAETGPLGSFLHSNNNIVSKVILSSFLSIQYFNDDNEEYNEVYPKILNKKPHTTSSNIYTFEIMQETMQIFEGKTPPINKAQHFYVNLIKKCWD
ncbi:kinase-like domain-containing protein [Gigaspora rosea]|uniref:Kinase-like domain-containing protein n=1 Tax=Gigaspora rosea TaxID=44941 RepID=A0A397W4B4_9GLOM|nr:kinase-like domain-containing protein [Gigaspora rosea]